MARYEFLTFRPGVNGLPGATDPDYLPVVERFLNEWASKGWLVVAYLPYDHALVVHEDDPAEELGNHPGEVFPLSSERITGEAYLPPFPERLRWGAPDPSYDLVIPAPEPPLEHPYLPPQMIDDKLPPRRPLGAHGGPEWRVAYQGGSV